MTESVLPSDRDPATTTFPRGVTDPLCPSQHVIETSTDRRLLWHLEGFLAVSGTTEFHRDMGLRLSRYLHETCDHHWHERLGYMDEPLRQCLWCNKAEWLQEDGSYA